MFKKGWTTCLEYDHHSWVNSQRDWVDEHKNLCFDNDQDVRLSSKTL